MYPGEGEAGVGRVKYDEKDITLQMEGELGARENIIARDTRWKTINHVTQYDSLMLDVCSSLSIHRPVLVLEWIPC